MNDENNTSENKVNCPTDKAYVDIIDSNVIIDREFVSESGKPAKIAYYCRDCKKAVTPKRVGKKLSFKCGECDREFIAFGTENSINSYYNVK